MAENTSNSGGLMPMTPIESNLGQRAIPENDNGEENPYSSIDRCSGGKLHIRSAKGHSTPQGHVYLFVFHLTNGSPCLFDSSPNIPYWNGKILVLINVTLTVLVTQFPNDIFCPREDIFAPDRNINVHF